MHIASNGLRGHGGLQTTSEVTSDLKIQLSDLDYLCSHVSLASKGLHELNADAEEVYHPLTCVASPQVIMEWLSHEEKFNAVEVGK